MPEYRIRSTGEVLSDKEFRRRHKNTSFSRLLDEDLLDAFDTDIVFEGPQKQGPPPYSYTYRDGVEKIGDKCYTKYSIRQQDKEPIDKQYADGIRIRRYNTGIAHTYGSNIDVLNNRISIPVKTERFI